MIQKRIETLQKNLEKGEAVLINEDNNRFYFTGFKSSAGNVLITNENSYLLIDFRYYEKAAKTVKHLKVLLCEKFYTQINELLKENGIKRLYIETDSVSLSQYALLKDRLSETEISNSNKIAKQIKKQRSIKSEAEIESIKKAQNLTDETFTYILNKIKTDVTEKEIMLDMEFFARSKGSEGVAFDFIVVSGKNSSLPHGVPTDKKIEEGDFITMDFGCVINGYRSDMTRTVAVGNVSDEQRLVYDTVLKAQSASLTAIKSGIPCNEIDKIARDIIAKAGFGKCFGHGLGHSVGLEIHESPACNTRDTTPLETGMIMTVEPGIYLEDKFGVRIEDMVVVTENGCLNLTNSSKELIIL